MAWGFSVTKLLPLRALPSCFRLQMGTQCPLHKGPQHVPLD